MPESSEFFEDLDFPVPAHAWSFPTVDGKVSFVVNGDVCVMYTFDADDAPPSLEEMFLGSALPRFGNRAGCPIEMTRAQVGELAYRLLESINAQPGEPPLSG